MYELPIRLIVAIAALGQEFYGLATVKELLDERKKSDSIFARLLTVPEFQFSTRSFSLLIYPYLSLICHTADVVVYNAILYIYIDTSRFGNWYPNPSSSE